jgi:hypothetical protein
MRVKPYSWRDGAVANRPAQHGVADGKLRRVARSLKPKHVEKLVERWLAENLSPG